MFTCKTCYKLYYLLPCPIYTYWLVHHYTWYAAEVQSIISVIVFLLEIKIRLVVAIISMMCDWWRDSVMHYSLFCQMSTRGHHIYIYLLYPFTVFYKLCIMYSPATAVLILIFQFQIKPYVTQQCVVHLSYACTSVLLQYVRTGN